MVFSSLTFLFVFLPVFLLVYFIFPSRPVRNIVLLLFSLLFYAWGEPIFMILMLVSIFMNYGFGMTFGKISAAGGRKRLLASAVLLNLLMLGIFKYSDMAVETINNILQLSLPLPHIPLPIGISFYTFQALSYVIDVYRGEVQIQRNPLYIGAYIAAFPQLIAGPIVRYETIENDLINRRETVQDFAHGLRRFIIGLGKKVLLANNLAVVVSSLSAYNMQDTGTLGAWVIILCYTFQIYFDFSGYSDMAIGLGRMLGFKYLENFNYPYIATSITEFWRRWHISLSTFFRDYLYFPLGGNRVTRGRWVFNILFVWLLTGLWHGANWNYVLWGCYFGLILLMEKLWLLDRLKRCPKFLQHSYTAFLFICGWVIFRTEDVGQIGTFFYAMFGGYGAGSSYYLITSQAMQMHYLAAFVVSIFASVPYSWKISTRPSHQTVLFYAKDIILFTILGIAIVFLLMNSYNPFIYFRF